MAKRKTSQDPPSFDEVFERVERAGEGVRDLQPRDRLPRHGDCLQARRQDVDRAIAKQCVPDPRRLLGEGRDLRRVVGRRCLSWIAVALRPAGMTPKFAFSTYRDAAHRLRIAARDQGIGLHPMPYRRFDPDADDTWWLAQSTDNPAYGDG